MIKIFIEVSQINIFFIDDLAVDHGDLDKLSWHPCVVKLADLPSRRGWLCAMPVWQNVNLKQKAAGGSLPGSWFTWNSPPALLHWKTPFQSSATLEFTGGK